MKQTLLNMLRDIILVLLGLALGLGLSMMGDKYAEVKFGGDSISSSYCAVADPVMPNTSSSSNTNL